MRETIDKILASLQDLLPQHFLTALVHRLMRSEIAWLKNGLITVISSVAGVDWGEAISTELDDYPSFNAFFTRELLPGARPLDPDPAALLSPCDGRVSAIGQLRGDALLQAKRQTYSLSRLLGNDPACALLEDGLYCTLYLAPADYHRVHMPLDGELQRMVYVPGKLYSVAPRYVREIPNLFALNERVVSVFETALGPVAVVLVGAMLVAGIDTVWADSVTPAEMPVLSRHEYPPGEIRLARGAEMGRFNMGSTVIVVAPRNSVEWREDLAAGSAIRVGERLGKLFSREA